MGQYVRFSLTGYVYFTDTTIDLSKQSSSFRKNLKSELVLGRDSLYGRQTSIVLSKIDGLDYIFYNDSSLRESMSYQLSIMVHTDLFDHNELDQFIHSALAKVLKRHKAGLVIFSSVSDEKYTNSKTVRLGSWYQYSERFGLKYIADKDFSSGKSGL